MKYSRFLVTAMAAATLSACGGGGSSGGGAAAPAPSFSSSASPSLGLVTNAAVNFYAADGSTLLGSGETGDDGQVTITFNSYNGVVVVELLGDDDDAMYFDESTGEFEPFPDGSSMYAILPGVDSEASVTPLTDIAYRAAVRNGLLPLTASEVNELNSIVSDALLGGIDVLSLATLVDDSTGMDLEASDAGRYALVLAALAYMGADGTDDPMDGSDPALAVLNALLADLADGTIDDTDTSTTPAGLVPAAYSDFAAEFTAAINAAAGDFANGDLTAELGNNPDYETVSTDLTALDDVENDDSGNGGGGMGGGSGSSCSNAQTVDTSGCQVLGTSQGVTGTLDGGIGQQTKTFSTNGSEGIADTITIFALGMPPADFGNWNLSLIANETGVQTCEDDGVTLLLSLTSGDSYIANGDTGSCQLEVTNVADEGGDTLIEGVFTGTMTAGDSNTDMTSKNVTSGAFRATIMFQ